MGGGRHEACYKEGHVIAGKDGIEALSTPYRGSWSTGNSIC